MNQSLTVSELTRDIKETLEQNIGFVSVTGEISNYKHHSSGHKYFTLKDDKAQITCVMWKTRQLMFRPKDGDKVIVTAFITVYPPRGNYQLDCVTMSPQGIGDLYLAFEELKNKLSERGYFDMERKRPIPSLPLKIGVATSKTGAAVRDILSTLERRFPGCEIYFRPTAVQGDEAAPDIVKAIKELNNTGAEVLIIGRGGGSLEDLWCFNTEIVADAIYNSKIPIISAVGHETDFTIADFVADARAATPTAAAELASPRPVYDLLPNIEYYKSFLFKETMNRIENMKRQLVHATERTGKRRIISSINQYNQQIDDIESRLKYIMKSTLSTKKQRIAALESIYNALHPYLPLKKGYALLEKDGKIIGNNESLAKLKNINIIRENEKAAVKVIKILQDELF